MLLKIFTSQNTIKIIEGIQDVEIHNESRPVLKWSEIYDLNTPPIRFTGNVPMVQNFDWKQNLSTEPMEPADTYIFPSIKDDSPAVAYPVNIKLVDYLRNGEWHRVAICQYAYLCNDDGKTISKID